MSRRREAVGAMGICLGVGPYLLMSCSCSSEGNGANPIAGDASTDAPIYADAVSDYPDVPWDRRPPDVEFPDITPPNPEGVPPGWTRWTAWSASCPLYIPGPGAEMPAPIEWEPCPEPVPQELACQRMKHNWGSPASMSVHPKFGFDSTSGAPLIQFSRIVWMDANRAIRFQLVAEADGVVRTAVLHPDPTSYPCQYFDGDVAGNQYVVNPLTQTGPLGALEEGVIGGSIDDREPTVILKLPGNENLTSNWYISERWIIQNSGLHTAWSWDGLSSQIIYRPQDDPDHLPGFEAMLHGEDVLIDVHTVRRCGVMSWNPTQGLQPLLRWYGDTTRGAGNFGTDGVDMVWTYAEGPDACTTDPATPEVWTAPYTLEPALVQSTARRVRGDVRGQGTKPYSVGHGYAARTTDFGTPRSNSLSVVRLTDGVAWVIAGDPNGEQLNWVGTLGFTEQELFVVATMKDTSVTIMRIRLDSLGPGEPPD